MVNSEEFVGVLSLLSHYTRKMELELTCPSCSIMLRMPTVLPCSHIFCSQCIPTKDKSQYKCPVCLSKFLQADIKHSVHIEEMISIFKSMDTSLTAIFQKLHSQVGISGRDTPTKKCVDLGNERTCEMQGSQVARPKEKMSSMGSPVAEYNDTVETPEGMKRPLPIQCPASSYNNTEEISQVSQGSVSAMKELSNESNACCHNSAKVKSSGPCHAGEQLRRWQLGVSGMKIQPEASTLPSNGNTKMNLQEKDTIDECKVKTEAELMLLSPETSNGEIQHSGMTNDANSCLPTYPPDASYARKSKRRKLGSKLDTNPNNQPLDTRDKLLDDKTETKEMIKANISSLSQINSVSLRQCIPENKCAELRMAALGGVCSDWMLCGSDLSTSEEEILLKFASLTGSSITGSWKKNTTHVIVSTDVHGACSRTLKVLKAILRGKWVLTIEWIKTCMKDGHFVPEERFEISQVGLGACTSINGPKKGRLNAINKAPNIFSGLRFYFSDHFEPIDRGIWEDLVVDAGGTVLQKEKLTCSRAELSSFESSYFVVNEGYQEKWSEFERKEAVRKRSDEAVDMKLKTGFQVVCHTHILDTIAACNSATDLAKCVISLP
ncbi:BRCA1-associated RING domain protein 1-like isoform X4 [Iris pallida]|uniref:BRCA1-associated RING domain protein 1-like isoform X4 n=1 Tax=Iris pallida TaxID=29817 RepID=A0AAX6IIU1_IRIPA|nr:BRCA1-associated RING domain protein 1-like isoform X4 [Iris pallida]